MIQKKSSVTVEKISDVLGVAWRPSLCTSCLATSQLVTMRAWLGLVCLACVQGFVVQPPTRLPCARSAAPRAASPSMLLPPIPLDVAASSVSTSLPSTVLVSDAFELITSFGNSPFVLLIPIGAGTLVASLIIWVLVKSAG